MYSVHALHWKLVETEHCKILKRLHELWHNLILQYLSVFNVQCIAHQRRGEKWKRTCIQFVYFMRCPREHAENVHKLLWSIQMIVLILWIYRVLSIGRFVHLTSFIFASSLFCHLIFTSLPSLLLHLAVSILLVVVLPPSWLAASFSCPPPPPLGDSAYELHSEAEKQTFLN